MDLNRVLNKLLEQKDSSFAMNVPVELILTGAGDYDVNTKEVNLSYDIEIEWRSYGIHGINLTVRTDKVVLNITLYDGDKVVEEKDIEIDLSNLTLSWVKGDGFYPVNLVINASYDNGKISLGDFGVELEVAYLYPG